MLNKGKIFVLVCSIIIVLSTCTYKTNDPALCYTETILPILSSNCAACHGTFLSYEGTLNYIVKYHPLRSKLYQYIKGPNPKMPPDSHKLTAQQVYYIKAWISMGAPNSSNCTICDTNNYKFEVDIKQIMTDACVGCHNPYNASGTYDLSSYYGVNRAAVNGKLMGSIKHSSGYSPMPSTGISLRPCQINKIQSWVNAGHPNN